MNIMKPPEPNDPLDELLHPPGAYRDDNGFTARVVAALPRRRRAWVRPVVLLGAVAIGAVLAVRWLPWTSLPVPDWSHLHALDAHLLAPWVLVITVPAALVWGVIAAMRWNE